MIRPVALVLVQFVTEAEIRSAFGTITSVRSNVSIRVDRTEMSRTQPLTPPTSIQSPSLTAYDDQPDRWIDVRWDIDEDMKERFPARITVTAINEPGSLANIAQVVAANDANIHMLSMVRTAPDFTEMIIDLEVWDLKQLNRLLSQLKDNPSVSEARRVNG